MSWSSLAEAPPEASLLSPCPAHAGAMGSPGFVSPEVIMHEAHTPAMDIYSLGVVLFIMLVGRKPYNIKEIENLSYCNLDIHDAPGLQDSRCVRQSDSM